MRPGHRQIDAADRKPDEQSKTDDERDQARVANAGDAKRDARAQEIDRAVQEMRARNQDHARADRDEAQRRTDPKRNRDGADDAGEQGSAKRLDEGIATDAGQPPAQGRASTGTERNDEESEIVGRAKNLAECRGSRAGEQHEAGQRNWRKARDGLKLRVRLVRTDPTVAELLDGGSRRRNFSHVDAQRRSCNDLVMRSAIVVDPYRQFPPAREDCDRETERTAELLQGRDHLMGGLAVFEQQPGTEGYQGDVA